MLPTPVNYESLTFLRTKIEQNTAFDSPDSHRIQKLANAAEKAFADRAILLDENKTLFDHNNEKMTRQSVRSTMVGKAQIMSYEAIVEAEQNKLLKQQLQVQNEAGVGCKILRPAKDHIQKKWNLASVK